MKCISVICFIIFLNSCSLDPGLTNGRNVQYIESDGAYLPVVISGPDTKKVIIFTHGGPGLSSMLYYYMPFLEKLSQKYKVVYWDQRGAGGSRGHVTRESITVTQFVKDMDVVYTYTKILFPDSEIYVMGHSYGGMVGGAYVSKFNDKIKASIFVSPAFNVGLATESMVTLMRTYIVELLKTDLSAKDRKLWEKGQKFYKDIDKLKASQFTVHSKWAGKRDLQIGLPEASQYAKNILPTLVNDNILENTDFLQESHQILVALQSNNEHNRNLSTDTEFPLGNITHPVFVAIGDEDVTVPPDTSREGYNSLNGGNPSGSRSELYVMPNTSHSGFLQPIRDELFNKIITFIEAN